MHATKTRTQRPGRSTDPQAHEPRPHTTTKLPPPRQPRVRPRSCPVPLLAPRLPPLRTPATRPPAPAPPRGRFTPPQRLPLPPAWRPRRWLSATPVPCPVPLMAPWPTPQPTRAHPRPRSPSARTSSPARTSVRMAPAALSASWQRLRRRPRHLVRCRPRTLSRWPRRSRRPPRRVRRRFRLPCRSRRPLRRLLGARCPGRGTSTSPLAGTSTRSSLSSRMSA